MRIDRRLACASFSHENEKRLPWREDLGTKRYVFEKY